ncbi:ribosomal RNA small subunit methyltransferase A, partial [bacterium]
MPIKPKKRLGQNFLADTNIREKLVKAAEFNPQDTILEIGPGRGEITSLLLPKVRKVYALEIDGSLCSILKQTLGDYPNLELINKDILKFDLNSIPERVKVIGNIPYYISTPIIEHLFEYREKIQSIFMTVQKEFAVRMSAAPGSRDHSSLSCFVQYYCEPK